VVLLLGPEKRLSFNRTSWSAGYEFWNLALAPETLKALFSMPRVQMEENISPASSNATQNVLEFDSSGLEDGWKKVTASCGAGEPVGVPRASGPPAFMASPAARVTTTRPMARREAGVACGGNASRALKVSRRVGSGIRWMQLH
jgi:hypothetical protein